MKKLPLKQPSLIALLVAEILLGTILAASAFLLFADLSQRVLTEDTLRFDQTITALIYSLRSPVMTEVMLFMSFLGGNFLLIPGILMFWYLVKRHYRREAILFCLAILTAFLLNILLKTIIARARPDVAPMIVEFFYSFPSTHSMVAFVFYSLLAYLSFHLTRNIYFASLTSLFCAVLILLIGVSRIYLGVHYPSDVVAGFLAGCGWLLTVLVLDRTIALFRTGRKK